MISVKIGAVTHLPTDGAELARRVRIMDKSGFDSLWMYETCFAAESVCRAGFIAACTENASIACGVLNPYTRHPGLIALAAATLDRIANGRLILVMGAGGKEWMEGILRYTRRKPATNVVGAVEVVRRMLAGDKVTLDGPGFSIRNAVLDEPPLRPRIPIYFAAEREEMLKTVAKVADGVWLFQMPSVGYVRWACECISQARANASLIEVGTVFPLRITDDSDKECEELKPWMAFYLSQPGIGEQYLQRGGYDETILRPIREAMKTDRLANPHDAFKVGNVAEAVKHVPTELVEDSTIIGTAAECRERLDELERAGLTFVALSFQNKFDQTMEKVHDILPN